MTKSATNILIYITLTVLLCVSTATKVVAAPKTYKIAYIEISRVFDNYQHTIDAEKDLEKLKEEKQKKLDKKFAEIKVLKEQLETLSGSDREKKQTALTDKLAELKEENKGIRTELTKTRDEIVQEILKDIKAFVANYAKRRHYDFIFSDRTIIYKNEEFDLSDEIIKQLNEKYKKAKK